MAMNSLRVIESLGPLMLGQQLAKGRRPVPPQDDLGVEVGRVDLDLFTIPHFDNYAAVLLHLKNADEADLREALEDAWLVYASADIAETYLEQRGSDPPGVGL